MKHHSGPWLPLLMLLPALVLGSTALAQAPPTSFAEEFDAPSLDPAWEVVEFTGPFPRAHGFTSPANRFSLSAAPGKLRYLLDPMTHPDGFVNGYRSTSGQHSCCSHDPGLELHRRFGGEHWSLETEVTYNMPFTNGRSLEARIYFGSGGTGTVFVALYRVRDVNQNSLQVLLIEKTGAGLHERVVVEDVRTPLFDKVVFRAHRDGSHLTTEWSADGVSWTTAFSRELGAALDGLDQRVVLTGLSWFNTGGSYADYEYVRLVGGREILAPVAGDLGGVHVATDCPALALAGKWCFNQHQGPSHVGNGVGGADDRFAWDANLNWPSPDTDAGRPVFAVAPGIVAATYGGVLNADPQGSEGQVLIEHQDGGTTWWSGYLHMETLRVRPGDLITTGTWLGRIASVGASTPHLHFVVYEGDNQPGGLASVDATLLPRPDGDADGVPDSLDACPGAGDVLLDANADGCTDSPAGLQQVLTGLALPPGLESALLATLHQVERSLARGNDLAALGQLGAFEHQIQAQRGRRIDPLDADLLCAMVQALRLQI